MEDNKEEIVEEIKGETKVEENAKPKNNKKSKKILIICIIIFFVGFCACLGYLICLNNAKNVINNAAKPIIYISRKRNRCKCKIS